MWERQTIYAQRRGDSILLVVRYDSISKRLYGDAEHCCCINKYLLMLAEFKKKVTIFVYVLYESKMLSNIKMF